MVFMSIKFYRYTLVGNRKIKSILSDSVLRVNMKIEKGELIKHLF